MNEDAGTTSNNADSNNEAEDSDSEVDNSSDFEFAWCDIDANFVEPDLLDFQEPVGVTSEAGSAKSPLECFKLFFTPVLLSILVSPTNLYASQLRTAKAPFTF